MFSTKLHEFEEQFLLIAAITKISIPSQRNLRHKIFIGEATEKFIGNRSKIIQKIYKLPVGYIIENDFSIIKFEGNSKIDNYFP